MIVFGKTPEIRHENRIKLIRKKWKKIGDTAATRYVNSLLDKSYLSPMKDCIDDDLKSFKTFYSDDEEQEKKKLEEILRVSCILGANKITQYLCKQQGFNYTGKNFGFMLPYACASKNNTLILYVANMMVENGIKEIPEDIHLFNFSLDMHKKLKKLFANSKKNNRITNKKLF